MLILWWLSICTLGVLGDHKYNLDNLKKYQIKQLLRNIHDKVTEIIERDRVRNITSNENADQSVEHFYSESVEDTMINPSIENSGSSASSERTDKDGFNYLTDSESREELFRIDSDNAIPNHSVKKSKIIPYNIRNNNSIINASSTTIDTRDKDANITANNKDDEKTSISQSVEIVKKEDVKKPDTDDDSSELFSGYLNHLIFPDTYIENPAVTNKTELKVKAADTESRSLVTPLLPFYQPSLLDLTSVKAKPPLKAVTKESNLAVSPSTPILPNYKPCLSNPTDQSALTQELPALSDRPSLDKHLPSVPPRSLPVLQSYQSVPQSYQSAPQSYQSAPQSYQSAPQSYKSVPQSYQSVQHSYQSAPQSYQSAPQSYQSTPQSYQSAPQSYQLVPQSYQSVPQSYQSVSQSYQSAPQTYQSAPQSYQSVPQSYQYAPQIYQSVPQRYQFAPQIYHSATQSYQSVPQSYQFAPYTYQYIAGYVYGCPSCTHYVQGTPCENSD